MDRDPHRVGRLLNSLARNVATYASLSTVAALGATPQRLLDDLEYFGFVFESLVVRDLRIYAKASDGEVLQYRDNTGLDVDAVVQVRDGRWATFEVKLGMRQVDEDARNLSPHLLHAFLAENLWDSLSEAPEVLALTDAQRAELDRRIQAHRSDPEATVSWDTLRQELLNG